MESIKKEDQDYPGPLQPREGGWTAPDKIFEALLCIPLHGLHAARAHLDHAAQLGHHVQALLLAQVLGTHDGLLVEQVAGAGLLLEVTLDNVNGPIHLLAGNLSNPLVGDGYGHMSAPALL